MSTRRQYAIAALVCLGAIALTMVLMWRHYQVVEQPAA